MTRIVRILPILLILSAATAQEAAPAPPPIRSGCEVDYPPFCIVREDGRADGFSVELLRAALAKMDREVTFRTGPFRDDDLRQCTDDRSAAFRCGDCRRRTLTCLQ